MSQKLTSTNQTSSIGQISVRENHENLVNTIRNAKINFVQIGALLYFLKQDDNFKLAVGSIDTWEEYLRQPEISLSSGEASRLEQIYSVFCEKFGYSVDRIAAVPIKNLHYLLPIAKESKDIEDLLNDAEHLSQKDFRERVFEAKNTDDTRTYEYILMQKTIETGNLKKVHGIDSQKLKETFNLE